MRGKDEGRAVVRVAAAATVVRMVVVYILVCCGASLADVDQRSQCKMIGLSWRLG